MLFFNKKTGPQGPQGPQGLEGAAGEIDVKSFMAMLEKMGTEDWAAFCEMFTRNCRG